MFTSLHTGDNKGNNCNNLLFLLVNFLGEPEYSHTTISSLVFVYSHDIKKIQINYSISEWVPNPSPLTWYGGPLYDCMVQRKTDPSFKMVLLVQPHN